MIKAKNFTLFLVSQSVVSLSEAFRMVAVTIMIFNLTHSSLSATFGFLCSPILSLLFSASAGRIGDKLNSKNIVVILDVARAILTLNFAFCKGLMGLYLTIAFLALTEIFYCPARRKLMSGIISGRKVLKGNSLINGINGAVFIIGPMAAGAAVDSCSPEFVLLMGSILSFVSAIQIFLIKYNSKGSTKTYSCAAEKEYAKARSLIFLGAFLCLANTMSSIAFYQLSFDILQINAHVWGIMLSVFYGAGMLATFIAIAMEKLSKKRLLEFCYAPIALISVVWIMYGVATRIGPVLLFLFFEGIASAFLGIVIGSELQVSASPQFLARVMGLYDIVGNVGRLLGLGFAYLLLFFTGPRTVFFFGAALLGILLLKIYIKDNIITSRRRGV